MKRLAILIAAAACCPPAAAQVAAVPSVPEAAAGIDPARIAAAQPVVDKLWPLGTYARMMEGTFDTMMEEMFGAMLGMRVGDVVPDEVAAEAGDDAVLDATMGEVIAGEDPHFAERMRIVSRVMGEAMMPVMSKAEPRVREALVRAYARRFSGTELADLDRFLSTPSGAAYARDALLVMVDPEMMKAMGEMMPLMMKAMPDITHRMEAAMAHLPPPPRAKADMPASGEGRQRKKNGR